MAYFVDLFSPETYAAFRDSARDVAGFRLRQKAVADQVKAGDIFVCYLTRLSRWFGVLEVTDGPYIDSKPDPFVVRFGVRTVTLLDAEKAIPIHDDGIWKALSFTRNLVQGSLAWTGKVRSSLTHLEDSDGRFLVTKIKAQSEGGRPYPLDEDDVHKLAVHTIKRSDKVIVVSVPDDSAGTRESIRVQALIASIGLSMGFAVWIPRADREAVLKELDSDTPRPLEELPLNYDEPTLRTIERIDVIWLRNGLIVRAFKVEHAASCYSGILRIADLLALEPNLDIKLHIVAPVARRDKVFSEICRPVFSLLERGPLRDRCTFLAYDSISKLASEEHLAYQSDGVLDEYAEEPE